MSGGDKKPLAGITSFGGGDDDEDYIAPPAREVREKVKAVGEAIGFHSEKASVPAPVSTPAKRGRRPLPVKIYDHQYTIRMREEDRVRFDDLAYQYRIPKGELFKRLLDLAQACAEEGRGL